MRTFRSSSCLLGGGGSAQGGLPGGVSAPGPNGVYPSMQQTPVKT